MYTPYLQQRSLALRRGRLPLLILALVLVLAVLLVAHPLPGPTTASAPAITLLDLGKLPLSFAPNVGHAPGTPMSTLVIPTPPPPPPGPNLAGSYKSASQHTLAPGEVLTYTIRLHNSGTAGAVADVTDQVPAEVNYVIGSATEGGVYDPATRTLSWISVTVPVTADVPLSFVVTATAVVTPTVVTNTATITTDGDSFDRHAWVLLVPERPPDSDPIPPVVHSLTIDEQDVLTSPAVTLHISATDNISVTLMYLREWQLATTPWPHWEIVRSSGWVPYQADYPWTLGPESGTRFVGVWVADDAHNTSWLDRRSLDFASLLLPEETVDKGGMVPHLVYYEAGVDVSAVLTPTIGDADLYVWYPGNFFLPDQKSTLPGTATDAVNFTTPRAGPYLFLVYGYEASTYNLSITPGGGPRAGGMAGAQVGGTGRLQMASAKLDELTSEPVLTWSGLDPMGDSANAPAGPPAAPGSFTIYLPMIIK